MLIYWHVIFVTGWHRDPSGSTVTSHLHGLQFDPDLGLKSLWLFLKPVYFWTLWKLVAGSWQVPGPALAPNPGPEPEHEPLQCFQDSLQIQCDLNKDKAVIVNCKNDPLCYWTKPAYICRCPMLLKSCITLLFFHHNLWLMQNRFSQSQV